MLDRLPAWVRHMLIVFGAVFGGSLCARVVDAGGVLEVDWLPAAAGSFNAASVVAASTAAALWFTPLTKQYGRGSQGAGGE